VSMGRVPAQKHRITLKSTETYHTGFIPNGLQVAIIIEEYVPEIGGAALMIMNYDETFNYQFKRRVYAHNILGGGDMAKRPLPRNPLHGPPSSHLDES